MLKVSKYVFGRIFHWCRGHMLSSMYWIYRGFFHSRGYCDTISSYRLGTKNPKIRNGINLPPVFLRVRKDILGLLRRHIAIFHITQTTAMHVCRINNCFYEPRQSCDADFIIWQCSRIWVTFYDVTTILSKSLRLKDVQASWLSRFTGHHRLQTPLLLKFLPVQSGNLSQQFQNGLKKIKPRITMKHLRLKRISTSALLFCSASFSFCSVSFLTRISL